MNHRWKRVLITCFMVIALVATMGIVGCGDNGDGGKKVVKVGMLTDLSGVAAPGIVPLTWSLEDMVKELNAGLAHGPKLPEGVELQVILYDTAFNPARFVPGYEWLKDKGCQVIMSVFNDASEVLKDRAAKDKIAIMGLATSLPMVEPVGWVFSMDVPTNWAVKLVLKWIADHWDYEGEGRSPKIATVGWNDAWGAANVQGTQEYIAANPDKFEYVGTWLSPVGTGTWSGEVNKTLDCDWVQTAANGPTMAASFWKQYKQTGGKGKNFDTESMSAYVKFITDFASWDYLDGKINAQVWGWWNLAGKAGWDEVTYVKEVLLKYHPNEAADTMAQGMGYLGGGAMQLFALQVVVQAIIDAEGAENFSGQAFYDTAVDYSADWCGATFGFTPTRRYVAGDMLMLEWSAADEDLIMVSDGWLAVPGA